LYFTAVEIEYPFFEGELAESHASARIQTEFNQQLLLLIDPATRIIPKLSPDAQLDIGLLFQRHDKHPLRQSTVDKTQARAKSLKGRIAQKLQRNGSMVEGTQRSSRVGRFFRELQSRRIAKTLSQEQEEAATHIVDLEKLEERKIDKVECTAGIDDLKPPNSGSERVRSSFVSAQSATRLGSSTKQDPAEPEIPRGYLVCGGDGDPERGNNQKEESGSGYFSSRDSLQEAARVDTQYPSNPLERHSQYLTPDGSLDFNKHRTRYKVRL